MRHTPVSQKATRDEDSKGKKHGGEQTGQPRGKREKKKILETARRTGADVKHSGTIVVLVLVLCFTLAFNF